MLWGNYSAIAGAVLKSTGEKPDRCGKIDGGATMGDVSKATNRCSVCAQPSRLNCAKCKSPYCSVACQTDDWKNRGHKKACKRLVEAAAAKGLPKPAGLLLLSPWCALTASSVNAPRMSAALPWLKIARMTAQYFPPEGRTTPGPFGKSYKNLVTEAECCLLYTSPSPRD